MLKWDSPAMLFLKAVADYVFVTLLLALCSIPLVTFGAAACAAYDTVRRCLIKEEGHVPQTFFKSFRANFKQATILWLICAVIGVVLWQGVRVMMTLYPDNTASTVLQGVLLFIGMVMLVLLLYGLAGISRFDNALGNILRNSLLLSIRNLWRTLGLLLLAAVGGVLIYFVPLLAIIIPALLVFFWVRCMEKAFAPYLPAEEPPKEDADA